LSTQPPEISVTELLQTAINSDKRGRHAIENDAETMHDKTGTPSLFLLFDESNKSKGEIPTMSEITMSGMS
jgi:hypothetical protein